MKYGLDTGKQLTIRRIHQMTKLPSTLINQVEKSALQKLFMHRNGITPTKAIGEEISSLDFATAPTVTTTVTQVATASSAAGNTGRSSRNRKVTGKSKVTNGKSNNNNNNNDNTTINHRSWIQEIFEGSLHSETRCVQCGTKRTKQDTFFDLSIQLNPNTSITHCLNRFSDRELVGRDEKYYCDYCAHKQEVYKRFDLI